MKWHHWCFFWVGPAQASVPGVATDPFGSAKAQMGEKRIRKMSIRVLTAQHDQWSRILTERKYPQWEQSRPFPVSCAKSVSVWLALLEHTGAHGIHVGSVSIVSLVSWLLLLFDATWVVSMHDRQDPEDAAATSDPFGSTKVNGGWTKFKRNKHEMVFMVVSLWMATVYNADVVRFVFEVSVVYRYVVNFPEVADAMCSIANLCIYCSCWWPRPEMTWSDIMMLLLGRNQLKLPYLGSQQIHLVLQAQMGEKE